MTRLRSVYLICATAAVLMLVSELVAHLGLLAYQSKPAPTLAGLPGPVQHNYSHMPPADVAVLLQDTAASRWRYEPIVGFVAEQQHTRFINVNAKGIRSNGTGNNPIDDAIWFFGGSTAFGYGVADRETIPAFLEAQMGKPVINFGVPGHYSVHETRLLSQQLRLGFRPSMVVFLDDVNESCEADIAEAELGDLVARSQRGYFWQPAGPVLLASRIVLARTMRTLGLVERSNPNTLELTCEVAARRFPLAELTARALTERGAICRLYELDCRTFIQPFATVHGRFDAPVDEATAAYLGGLYEHLEPVWRNSDVTFLVTALDTLEHHAYIDEVHYSASAHRLIAEVMAGRLAATAPRPGGGITNPPARSAAPGSSSPAR